MAEVASQTMEVNLSEPPGDGDGQEACSVISMGSQRVTMTVKLN